MDESTSVENTEAGGSEGTYRVLLDVVRDAVEFADVALSTDDLETKLLVEGDAPRIARENLGDEVPETEPAGGGQQLALELRGDTLMPGVSGDVDARLAGIPVADSIAVLLEPTAAHHRRPGAAIGDERHFARAERA